MVRDPLTDDILKLLSSAGIDPGEVDIKQLEGGANNRVFRVTTGQDSFLVKAYFHHSSDPRDRLGAEFSFSSFAWHNGIRCLPEPISRDSSNKIGLFRFIDGRKLKTGEASAEHVQQAVSFYKSINKFRDTAEARKLPNASEACFSLSSHLDCIGNRIERLALNLSDAKGIDIEAKVLMEKEVIPAWNEILHGVASISAASDISLEDEIPASDRCLSPSDFGFHNAILPSSGDLAFIDFEYAGWDDPAKTVCDFFCQPAVPAPQDMFSDFASCAASLTNTPEATIQRMLLLFPVYQLKWITIVLNDFLPVGNARRTFATVSDRTARKATQLEKARALMQHVGNSV